MTKKVNYALLIFFLVILANAQGQENLNRLDKEGNKQGHWIKKYPDGTIMYEGYFVDNQPAGEFKRYDDEGNLVSVLIHKEENDTVRATFYHKNGYIAAKGSYLAHKKEGEWYYYSDYIEEQLLMKCQYDSGMIDGIRIKYHWNGKVAENLMFVNGNKSGKWTQYFTDGTLCLEAKYETDKLTGPFKSWHPNGKPEIIGQYNNNVRDGKWYFYNNDGSLRREIKYNNGIPENKAELIREETEYLDRLEKEGGKISDPEKTGFIEK